MNLYFSLIILSIPSLAALFEPVTSLFVWDKNAIASGQLWRILTGNFAHTNFEHCLMNLAALWMIALIFRPKGLVYAYITVVISVAVGISLLLTSLQQYVGLSGSLHGIFVYLALCECFSGRKSSALFVLGVIAKVMWEQIFGPSSYTQEMIQAPVAIQAHLAGLISGVLLAVMVFVFKNHIKKPRQ